MWAVLNTSLFITLFETVNLQSLRLQAAHSGFELPALGGFNYNLNFSSFNQECQNVSEKRIFTFGEVRWCSG